jgi:hypothetical protein
MVDNDQQILTGGNFGLLLPLCGQSVVLHIQIWQYFGVILTIGAAEDVDRVLVAVRIEAWGTKTFH